MMRKVALFCFFFFLETQHVGIKGFLMYIGTLFADVRTVFVYWPLGSLYYMGRIIGAFVATTSLARHYEYYEKFKYS